MLLLLGAYVVSTYGGFRLSVSDVIPKWRTFRPLWPTLSGPGRQPLGGSISLKFLLETRLQSESFDIWMTCWGFRFKSCDVS